MTILAAGRTLSIHDIFGRVSYRRTNKQALVCAGALHLHKPGQSSPVLPK